MNQTLLEQNEAYFGKQYHHNDAFGVSCNM